MANTPSSVSPSVLGTAAMLLRDEAQYWDAVRDGPTSPLAAQLHAAATHLEALEAEHRALIREVEAWRWLHWGKADASWACPCGNALGAGLDDCPECGTLRPRRDRPHAVRGSSPTSETTEDMTNG